MRGAIFKGLAGAMLVGAAAHADVGDVVRLAYDGLCARVTQPVNLILHGYGWKTDTRCTVVADGKQVVMLLATHDPIFAAGPAARHGWTLVVITAAGKAIRESGIRVDDLGLADGDMLGRHKMMRIPAAFASRLQADVHDGSKTVAAAVAEIDARLKPEDVPDVPKR